MAELADALDSGSSRGNSVDVQVILAANLFKEECRRHPALATPSGLSRQIQFLSDEQSAPLSSRVRRQIPM